MPLFRSHSSPLVGWLVLWSLFQLACGGIAAEPTTSDDLGSQSEEAVEYFRQRVQPILQRRCWKCHDAEQHKGGLDLTRREHILAGGDSGPAFDADSPHKSLILSAIRYEGLEMPPTGQLPDEEFQVLLSWIERGLAWDQSVGAESPDEPFISDADRNHWSFRAVKMPPVPTVDASGWCRNPIDCFVWRELDRAGLRPNPEADRRTLVRRLYFDVLGLPPSPETVQQFENDLRPDAYDRMVDRLLASPQFGEQWARHWLDLVRYAETNSFERDDDKPNAWRYRDYVVRSLNADKSYRTFITEQLAGDELDQVTTDSLIATGFYRLGLWDDEPTDSIQAYYDHLDDVVTVASQATMGLTLNCARCHDHKVDPILQADYYRFLAFFHNILNNTTTEGESAFRSPFTLNTQRDIATDEQRAAYESFRAGFEQRMSRQTAEVEGLEQAVVDRLSQPEQEDARNAEVRQRLIDARGGDILGEPEWSRLQGLRRQVAESKLPAPDFPHALVVAENGPQPRETFVLVRGNAHVPGAAVTPGFPTVLGFPDPPLNPPRSTVGATSGRRSVVAEWLFVPTHPLTARVAVNRLWQHHLGKGLVRSPNDFGLQGDRPTHPELLDWLASMLIREEWSMKNLHRRILLSATYRISSEQRNDRAASVDPQNILLWRAEMRRLSAEQLRDAILSVNGSLNPKMGGPSMYPAIPAAVMLGQSRPGKGWLQSSPAEQSRRSVYAFAKRSLSVPLLNAFDAPDTDFSCPVRFATTQPTQALTMLNSEELGRLSAEFAESLRTFHADPESFVRAALTWALARTPDPMEVERGQALIERLCQEHGQPETVARQQFCLMILNLNEFIYVD